MRRLFLRSNRVLAVVLLGLLASPRPVSSAEVPTAIMKTKELGGHVCVSATDLEREAGVAIKSLPGQDAFVACRADRCALIKDCVRQGGQIWVPVDHLAGALGAHSTLSPTGDEVSLLFSSHPAPAAEEVVRVGQLAPDFRLTKLDGTTVALSDFRGRRVLINSWASW